VALTWATTILSHVGVGVNYLLDDLLDTPLDLIYVNLLDDLLDTFIWVLTRWFLF